MHVSVSEVLLSVPDFATQSTARAPSGDDALVGRVRAGDESACEELYRTYHEPLWKFVYTYVRSSDIAEELVQDVFFALWRDRARWQVRVSVRAWLYAAVRNQALNQMRHERVRARLMERVAGRVDGVALVSDPSMIAMGEPAPDAQAMAECRELDDVIAQAIATLPERRRTVMMLRWKHGLTAAEIASLLGTSPESVRVLLMRARQDLTRLIAHVSV